MPALLTAPYSLRFWSQMFLKWTSTPSDCKAIVPLVGEHFLPSETFFPFM